MIRVRWEWKAGRCEGWGGGSCKQRSCERNGFFYVSCTVTEISINPAGPSSSKDRQCCAAVKTILISDFEIKEQT